MKATVTLNELWVKRKHLAREELDENIDKYNSDDLKTILDMVPEFQWTKDNLSIISPSGVTFGKYELYDGNETPRFDTLEEAQAYGDNLLSKKQ